MASVRTFCLRARLGTGQETDLWLVRIITAPSSPHFHKCLAKLGPLGWLIKHCPETTLLTQNAEYTLHFLMKNQSGIDIIITSLTLNTYIWSSQFNKLAPFQRSECFSSVKPPCKWWPAFMLCQEFIHPDRLSCKKEQQFHNSTFDYTAMIEKRWGWYWCESWWEELLTYSLPYKATWADEKAYGLDQRLTNEGDQDTIFRNMIQELFLL